jgi:Zn-dependent protease with chaperone function
MLRRLFFLFPDEAHAQRVVNQLVFLNISERNIHAISRGVALKTLPEATERQKNDTAFRVESLLWNANLLLFVIALAMFVVSLVMIWFYWSLVSLFVMAATFFAGEHFVVKVPDVHLTEFTDALSHGEILLMVDVPAERVAEIENAVHHRHPEAVVGGVGWAVDAFGI